MATVYRRQGSKNWMGAYRDARNVKRCRSTRTTDRDLAQRTVLAWAKAAKEARQGVLTQAACRKVLSELHEQATGKPLQFFTVGAWLDLWLTNATAPPTKQKTIDRYTEVTTRFKRYLGSKTALALGALASDDIRAFRDGMLAAGLSATTANQAVKILRQPFKQALDEGHIPMNPAKPVKQPKDAPGAAVRKAFKLDQIRALLKAAKGSDWEGMILLGAFAGLRLIDASRITWAQIDLGAKMLRVRTEKRGVVVEVPVHPALAAWLAERPTAIGKAPLFPNLCDKAGPGKSGLSCAFKKIMATAGVVGEIARKGRGEGRSVSTLSFHSTRHFFVSSLAAAGVAADVRQRLAGHTDEKTHAKYAAHQQQSLYTAISALPGL